MALLFIPTDEVEKYKNRKGVIFVDVREKDEYEEGHIEGAIHIPFEELEDRAHELSKYSLVILYCNRGNQSLLGTRVLGNMGCRAASLSGGYEAVKG